MVLKTNQWWKLKEKEQALAVIFHVLRVYENEFHEQRASIEIWQNDGSKEIIERSLSPWDLNSWELCSKAEALARLL